MFFVALLRHPLVGPIFLEHVLRGLLVMGQGRLW